MLKSRLLGFFALALMLTLIVMLSPRAASGSPASDGAIHFLTGPSQGEPLDIALDYLSGNVDSLGLSSDDLVDHRVSDQYASAHNGVTHIYLQQRYAGIDVYNALLNINVAADGSVINAGNRFVAGLAKAVNTTRPLLSPDEAVQSAAAGLGLTLTSPLTVEAAKGGSSQGVLLSDGGVSLEPIPVKLMYQPLESGAVRLAWDLSIYELDAQNYWSMRIDAVTGRELDRANLVVHDNFDSASDTRVQAKAPGTERLLKPNNLLLLPDQYWVFAEPAESPIHTTGRTLVANPADSTASPFGWHDTNGAAGAEYTITRGNNVFAYEDGNNPGFSPDGEGALDFSFPIDLGQSPDSYEAAAITNLFYWNNLIHDLFYQYGFTEAAGNFQENNYGNGGTGGDSVNAEAQDGGGTNNANFATPADGSHPTMQMYLWNLTSPVRDGDLDNGIIAHEYGHGISNRLTGGPSNVFCLQNTEQAGEGWSDWAALMMTIEAGDTGADPRGIGTYALGEPTNGPGIRDYRYSTNMAIDPRTYDEIKTAVVPHGVGSTWTAMLWEMVWALIDEYGFDPNMLHGNGGNNMAMQLVIDGMKLQPCSPGFVDARDAILAADLDNYGGVNQCLIWESFAKRGLGFSADQGSSGSRSDGTEAFDLPPVCLQTLKITKTANPNPVDSGALLTYSLLVENDTTGLLTNVTVTDIVPADTTYEPGSADCGGGESGGTVTFNIGSMAAGASTTCSFQVKVNAGLGTVTAFDDDMESGSGYWTTSHGTGALDWSLSTANPNSPSHAWFAQDPVTFSDQYLAMTTPVALSGQPILSFQHNYITEATYDGGVVEISTNGGADWSDLGPLMTQNGYNSTISTGYNSAIAGRQAFSGSSNGYLETRVDLSSYAGSSVQIRFRLASDNIVAATGWYVDDVIISDEDTVTNTACVSASEGDNACDTVVTLVYPGPGGDPQVTITPASLSATLNPGGSTDQSLTIGNTGTADLDWDITESADNCSTFTDIPWLSAIPIAAITPPAGSEEVTVSLDATGQSVGNHNGSLCVLSNDPDEGVVEVPVSLTVETAPAYIDQYASNDLPDKGTVSGNYQDTLALGGGIQTITERLSGGKPSNRYDYLSHAWSFNVAPGSSQTFMINAWQSLPGDADVFYFAYSTDNSNFVQFLTVSATATGAPVSASLPDNLSGPIYIRVYDSDDSPTDREPDTINVDYMAIHTTDPGQAPEPIVMHVHGFDGWSDPAARNRWSATAKVEIRDGSDGDLQTVAGALVTGVWSGAASGEGSCTTEADGTCTVTKPNIKRNRGSISFSVTDVARGTDIYAGTDNDVDFILIYQPE